MWLSLAFAFAIVATSSRVHCQTEQDIRTLVEEYNAKSVDFCNAEVQASWNVNTNVGNKDYEDVQTEVVAQYAEFQQQQHPSFAKIDTNTIDDVVLRRQVVALKQLGMSALSPTKLEEFTHVVNKMSSIYNTAVICPYERQQCSLDGDDVLKLDPDMHDIFEVSKDYDKLQYIWEEWHDKAGQPMRDDYAEYVKLVNEAGVINGHKNGAELWQSAYEDMDFDTIDTLWADVKPLYEELHKFVRNKLSKIYAGRLAEFYPHLPAHVLSNMWAQSWAGLYDSTKPFDIDDNLGEVTNRMAELNYDVLKMFEVADEFFTGMGLPSNAMSFDTTKAVIEAPTDGRQIACHASAWDFCKDNDFRIKMCTSVNLRDFVTIHHELGHIAYYQQYAKQPLPLRGGANPAFHEAIGDAIALSFSNPKHLEEIDLLPANGNVGQAREQEINAMYLMALERVAFLPFGLLIDKWRWEVFNGTTPQDKWNDRFWELRQQYQHIVPPSPRSADKFDAGAKFHVPADSQYIGYFFAGLLQFQLYRSFCIEAKKYDPANPSAAPLHQCDFYGSLDAGKKLMAGLEIGTSKPWPDVLEAMTGERTINGGALIEYFQPLYEHLVAVNKQTELETIKEQLQTHHQEAVLVCNALVNAEWDQITDLENVEKQLNYMEHVQMSAAFAKNQYNNYFKGLNPDDYDDVSVSRQLKYLTKLGTDILSPARLLELRQSISAMELVYNTAQVCPFDKLDCDERTEGLPLNPDIERIMGESQNFDELKHVWSKWHDNTGTHMRTHYANYLAISNEAAVLNGFSDSGEMWRFDYEDDNFQANMLQLWSEVEPLYDALHTYVRHRLIETYGDRLTADDPLIPAHLLGNMWAQSWVNLYERVKPFRNASEIDVTASMLEQFTVLKMFEESDRFYTDLGLKSNAMSYTGPKPIIEKPTDRLIVCHASAWDFCDGRDFRIKQCTQINQKDLVTVHHEMGHIQYYIQYAEQPMPFRKGANPGFHEAVGDLMALSISTPGHLERIGLLSGYKDTEEDNINALLKMALERVAFLPFGLLIDMYRWEMFAGKVPANKWNARWEELREKFQKIRSPVERSELNFDAGAKFHVASDYQYINYFVAHILEFQLHKAMCTVAGQLDNGAALHKCDIDGSKAVGAKLAAGLSAGLSRHWSETLETMTGDRMLKSDALLEYFEPLNRYLDRVNAEWKPPTTGEPDSGATTESPTTQPPNRPVDDSLPWIPIIVGSVILLAIFVGVLVGVTYYCSTRNRVLRSSASTNRLV